jgi:hypothetical protein
MLQPEHVSTAHTGPTNTSTQPLLLLPAGTAVHYCWQDHTARGAAGSKVHKTEIIADIDDL